MQNEDQSSFSSVPPSVSPVRPVNTELARRRVPSPSMCRSGPRTSRFAAVRESCASFRLACSLQPRTLERQADSASCNPADARVR